jgi:hypothetical protein
MRMTQNIVEKMAEEKPRFCKVCEALGAKYEFCHTWLQAHGYACANCGIFLPEVQQ